MSTFHAETALLTAPSSSEDIREVDVSSLFRLFCIKESIRAQFTRETYEFAEVPEENWLYPAFRSFQRLREEGFYPSTFATVGTGPGLDAIGAAHLLRPSRIIATDLHPKVIPVALRNIRANIDHRTEVTALIGDLCQPLRDAEITVDLAYANLPLLPAGQNDLLSEMRSSTFLSRERFDAAPEIYRMYRLAMIHVFLNDVRSSLNEGGRVLINLGARMPDDVIRQLFQDCRYLYRELFTMLKVQSQPEEVLPGFAMAEREGNVAFNFYRMEAAEREVGTEPVSQSSSESFLSSLQPFRVDAKTALNLHGNGEMIGHVVKMIEGIPFTIPDSQ